MYVIGYGKSPRALETGKKLIGAIGGRYVTGTELMTGSFVIAEGETDCAVLMILPLEAAVKSMEETITDKTRDLPVIAVSPEGRYAAIIRRGNKPYAAGAEAVYAAVVRTLGTSCFSSFEGKGGITSDLTNLVSRYGMAVNDKDVLQKINSKISSGEKVNVYTDLPIVFADPVIDPMAYSLHSYPYDMREDVFKQYKAAKEGRTEPSVFITCTYLGDEEDKNNLILVPKILSLGIEIKTKTDPGYCRPAIRKSLINHLLNPKAVATVASAYSARDSEIVKGLAEELGSEVVSYDSEKIAKTKVPMEMTFSPEKRTDTATALALLACSEGALLIRRATSAQGLVFSVAVSRSNIILPE
jgi:cobalamin biosynthesis protein CbiG